MKIKFSRTIAIFLIVTILIPCMTAFVANADDITCDNIEDKEHYHCNCNYEFEEHVAEPDITTVEDYYNFLREDAQVSRKKDIAMLGASNLPSSVDNSESPYFPEIGNQNPFGSCSVFSHVYYQFTYTMNKARNVATTPDNTFSAKWIFNLGNNGITSNGPGIYELLMEVGCPSAKSVPYDGVDYKSWVTDPDIWREAKRYRLKSYQKFADIGEEDSLITSVDDPDLAAIKTALNNGEILTFDSHIYSYKYGRISTHPDAPENDKFINEQYVKYLLNPDGGHSMTIVGYNDNIWCDINQNGQIDNGEMGAFKIANSWDTWWRNDGFLWIAYDALNEMSTVDNIADSQENRIRAISNVTRIDVRQVDEGSDIYAKFTLNTADRSQFSVNFTGELYDIEYERAFLEKVEYKSSNNKYAFDGSSQACDATFIYPLDNLIPDITNDNFESCDFSVTVSDSKADSVPLTIKDFCIVNENTGKEYKPKQNDFPLELDGSEYTTSLKEKTGKNTVIYYIGFDDPILHYKIGDSDFTEVSMQKNNELRGYLYRYVFTNVTEDITLYFSNKDGKTDDNNGEYFTATEELNYYYTKNQREPLRINDIEISNGTPDLYKNVFISIDVSGGYAPYIYKSTYKNLTTGKVDVLDYGHRFNNYPDMVKTQFTQAGTYEVIIETTDYANDTTMFSKIIEVTNQPFQIAVTPDKPNGIVSKPIVFESKTAFEFIATEQPLQSRFVVKNSNNEIVCDETVERSDYTYDFSTSTTYFTYTPTTAGEYTLTVSATDMFFDYAETTISFSVYDMIIGDTNGDGVVSITDATVIQQHLAKLDIKGTYYEEMADSDGNSEVNIYDVANTQRYLAQLSYSNYIGKNVGYNPNSYTADFYTIL